jgi:hypothetical protein
MIYQKSDQVELKSNYLLFPNMVDLINSLMLIALGFAPTLVAMEAAWRMGKIIGKRGEEEEEEKTTFVWRSV